MEARCSKHTHRPNDDENSPSNRARKTPQDKLRDDDKVVLPHAAVGSGSLNGGPDRPKERRQTNEAEMAANIAIRTRWVGLQGGRKETFNTQWDATTKYLGQHALSQKEEKK